MADLSPYALTLGWLYPKLMSTYGDRGNVICLQRRCQWRGIPITVQPLDQTSDPADFARVDLIVGGGAQDRQQGLVMRDLQGGKAAALKAALEDEVPGVFTCGSPQLLGHYYEPALGQRIEGLGILDLVSKHPGDQAQRCIGNVVFEVVAEPLATDLRQRMGGDPLVIGFENHGGRTYLGQVSPLGKVIQGYGNNGEDGYEGAFYKKAIATYAHGPLLPKNPAIADWLILQAIQRRYQTLPDLPPLADRWAEAGRHSLGSRLGLGDRFPLT